MQNAKKDTASVLSIFIRVGFLVQDYPLHFLLLYHQKQKHPPVLFNQLYHTDLSAFKRRKGKSDME